MLRKVLLLPTALVSLLFIVSATAAPAPAPAPAPYNFLDNYSSKAPSAEDGPPAAANASRNKNILPYQICGIVGGYIVTVLIWGVLLLTVGRRMRRKTENSPKTLELELVTKRPEAIRTAGLDRYGSINEHAPSLKSPVPASPASARSASSWFKRNFRKDKVGSPTIEESGQHSPVVQSPGSFDQRVLDADRQRAQEEMERLYAAVMDHDRKKSLSQMSNNSVNASPTASRRPSAINTSYNLPPSHSNPSSPLKPGYSSTYSHAAGPPTAPLPSTSHSYNRRPSLRDPQQEPASPRSVLSKKSHLSTSSQQSKQRFNLKNLRISGPVQKYPHDRDEDARTPLSPRYYNPGAPPSPPSMQTSPVTPSDMEDAYAYEHLDAVQPLPRPAPQRTLSLSSSNAPTPTATSNPTQYPTQYASSPAPRSATSSHTNLPLRSYTNAEPLKSPDLRTTVLDRSRIDRLGPNTPKTGVPFTPYSPYMPFTPITPVTPHLITKKERKRAKKYAGREEGGGMVQSPKEIFGDAW